MSVTRQPKPKTLGTALSQHEIENLKTTEVRTDVVCGDRLGCRLTLAHLTRKQYT